ncbi:hypothetical protein TI03_00695 [Achromatium sp. WMS1]|nr:hypothetical protein TI03_00695 [Achromatium sp. WMS1]
MNTNNFTQLSNVMYFAFLSIFFVFIIGCSTSEPRKLLPTKIVVKMNNTTPSGADWDIIDGTPDPYVIVDGRNFRHERCRDSYICTFSVFGDGPFNIEVWDADTTYDDSAGITLCQRGSKCHTSGASVTVH